MNEALDARLNAFRPDLADARLKGRVKAVNFTEGIDRRVAATALAIRRQPQYDSAIDTEALHGERVRVFEETADGWAWVQLESDGYVGWVIADALGPLGDAATHRVSALRTYVYPAPDMKLPPRMLLSMNARVSVRGEQGIFADIGDGFAVFRHLAPVQTAEQDWVATACRFVGTPYLWGGRTSLGLDCSALVQLALQASGNECPRDSDMQATQLGEPIDPLDLVALARGDLLFWKGHVGIVQGEGMLLHANGYHMETVIEPLVPAVERIAAAGFSVTGARRLQ